MTKKKYDWEIGKPPPPLDAHSRAKHEVLSNYLRRYIEIVAGPIHSEGLKLTLVDGFAGGGEYILPDGNIWHGSPLIMLNEVEAARIIQQKKRTKAFNLDAEFIFIEKRRKSASYLDAAIRRNNYGNKLGGEIAIVQGGFESQVDKIIHRIKSRGTAHRSFFVLDQYGYSTASFASIRKILTELNNSEILLTFYVDYIIDYLANTPEFLKAVKPADLDQKKVEELLSMKDQTGGRWFIQRFLLDHVRQATGARFFTYFFIKAPDSHRSLNHPLIFPVVKSMPYRSMGNRLLPP